MLTTPLLVKIQMNKGETFFCLSKKGMVDKMDDGGSSVYSIMFFVILLFVEAILTGFNKAIVLMDEKEIERRAEEEKDKKSILLNNIAIRSTIYINSIQMIITLIELIMGYYFLPRWTGYVNNFLQKFSFFNQLDKGMVMIIALVTSTFCLMYILLTVGILIPKKLAQKKPDAWAYRFIMPIHFLRTALYPLTGIVAMSANGFMKVLGFKSSDDQIDVTEEEIMSVVNEGHEQGVLEADEVEMITNIIEFGDKEANDIMIHRNNIVAIEKDTPFKEALMLMLAESNSRYPVYDDDLDHVIGVLYLKDAMRMHIADENLECPVGDIDGLLRDAVFIPESKNIDDLFRSMQADKNQIAIVMDEYGQTVGIVTMEDILEEIVGNIMDEYDPEENHIEEKGDNEYIIEGMTRLEDLEERFDIDFGETEFETLNGYIISLIDHIPEEDENPEVQIQGYNFKIVSVDKNVIQSILVTKLPEEQMEEVV